MRKATRFIGFSVLVLFLFVFQIGTAFSGTTGIQKYAVRKGDNLYTIGKKFNVSGLAIQKASGLRSDRLSIGQVLTIPTGKSATIKATSIKSKTTTKTTTTSKAQKYVVKKGDSLYTIGKKFGVSTSAIKQASKISSDKLHIGQVLYIPAKGKVVIPTRGNTTDGVPVGLMLDWWNVVTKMFPNGMTVQVIDVNTGLTFRVTRSFGHNHADVEPVTVQDTNTMKKAWGGKWSWDRRAVVVNISGRWVAASMNGMPHGSYKNHSNGMNGQVCMHFLNSRTHAGNRVDPDHQAMVRKAAGIR